MRKKKNSFTLIEVLIAIFLVTGACFFLLEFEESYIKSARESLKKVQKERLIQEAYVLLLEELYTNQIPWKVLEDGKIHRFTLSQPGWEAEAHFTPVQHNETEQVSENLLDLKIALTLYQNEKKYEGQPELRLCLKREERLNVQTPKA